MKCTRFLFILLTAFSFSFAQETASPESVGLSSTRLARIDAMVNTEMNSGQYAGRVVLVARGGKIAYLKAFGMADIESGKAMTTDAIFRQASMSKIITATAVMMLFEEGKLLLDDPVAQYIPELANPQVMVLCEDGEADCENYRLEPANGPVTVRHLLTHTSGITYGFAGHPFLTPMYWEAGISDGLIQTEGTIGDGMKKLAAMPLAHHPGEGYTYGLSLDMAGYLVEVVSGKSLDEFMRERIFEPLGMVDTYFFLPESKKDRMATAYAPGPEGDLVRVDEDRNELAFFVYSAGYPYSGPKTYFSGGGGLSATISDYYRFLKMLMDGGRGNGHRILSPSTIDLMVAGHVGELYTGWAGNSRGLGMSLVTNPAEFGIGVSKGSFWWGGFWNTDFIVDRDKDLISIGMMQLFPFFHIRTREKLVSVATQAIVGRPDVIRFKK